MTGVKWIFPDAGSIPGLTVAGTGEWYGTSSSESAGYFEESTYDMTDMAISGGFLASLVDYQSTQYAVSNANVFLSGYSQGGRITWYTAFVNSALLTNGAAITAGGYFGFATYP